MEMVVHEYPGVHGQAVTVDGLAQAAVEIAKVLVASEDRIAVVPAHHHVLRLAGQIEPWPSRHDNLPVVSPV
jgi:hypothetical protein